MRSLYESSTARNCKTFSLFWNTELLQAEVPVGRARRPWGTNWTEFELASAQVEPMDVIVNKMLRKIVGKYRPWNELQEL